VFEIGRKRGFEISEVNFLWHAKFDLQACKKAHGMETLTTRIWFKTVCFEIFGNNFH